MKRICVTNRHLVQGDFFLQIERVLQDGCDAVILREKDLDESEYMEMAEKVQNLCAAYRVQCMLHTYVNAAKRLNADAIHLPLHLLLEQTKKEGEAWKNEFKKIGVSVHSVADAKKAYEAGATYLTAGHVFTTDCKKGIPARGLDFLTEVCSCVPIPVYAIGGITDDNEAECIAAGAAGVCRMSSYMQVRFRRG